MHGRTDVTLTVRAGGRTPTVAASDGTEAGQDIPAYRRTNGAGKAENLPGKVDTVVSEDRPDRRSRGPAVALAAAVVAALLVGGARVDYGGLDARGTLLVSQALLEHGSVRLSDYPDAPDLGYRSTEVHGVRYGYFPLGPSLAALPAVALARLGGLDMRSARDDIRVQRWLAAVCVGIVLLLVHALGRRYLPEPAALFLAVAVTLGTSLTSTLGTAWWSMDPEILFLLLALLWALPDRSGRTPRPALAGTALWAAFLCRPTAVALIVPLLVLLALRDRRGLRRCAGTAALLLAGFVLWSLGEYGLPLPPYYLPRRLAEGGRFWTAIAGLLVSPSRGVLVASPLLTLLAGAAVYRTRRLARDPLFAVGTGWFLLHLAAVARFPHWWGGHSYLSRLMTESVPALLLIAIALWRRFPPRTPAWRALLGAAAAAGVLMHAVQGLYNPQTKLWNSHPDIDPHPAALFDWRYPQFLATAARNLARAEDHLARFAPGESTVIYGEGWLPAEGWGRWAAAPAAELRGVNVSLPARLVIRVASWRERPGPTVVVVRVDGREAGRFEVATPPWQWEEHVLTIPGSGRRTLDVRLEFPPGGSRRSTSSRPGLAPACAPRQTAQRWAKNTTVTAARQPGARSEPSQLHHDAQPTSTPQLRHAVGDEGGAGGQLHAQARREQHPPLAPLEAVRQLVHAAAERVGRVAAEQPGEHVAGRRRQPAEVVATGRGIVRKVDVRVVEQGEQRERRDRDRQAAGAEELGHFDPDEVVAGEAVGPGSGTSSTRKKTRTTRRRDMLGPPTGPRAQRLAGRASIAARGPGAPIPPLDDPATGLHCAGTAIVPTDTADGQP